jgi:hypothetical protein
MGSGSGGGGAAVSGLRLTGFRHHQIDRDVQAIRLVSSASELAPGACDSRGNGKPREVEADAKAAGLAAEDRLGLGGQTVEPKQKRTWRSSDVPLGDVPGSLSARKIENYVIGDRCVERLARKDDGRGADFNSPFT